MPDRTVHKRDTIHLVQKLKKKILKVTGRERKKETRNRKKQKKKDIKVCYQMSKK